MSRPGPRKSTSFDRKSLQSLCSFFVLNPRRHPVKQNEKQKKNLPPKRPQATITTPETKE
jgi:hypothetical protein